MNRNAERYGERIAQVNVAPSKRRRVQHVTTCRIDHAGHRNADTFTSPNLFVVAEYLLDATRKLLDQNTLVAVSLKTADNAELPAHQIGDEDVSARSANIDADDATLARVDVKKLWTAAASDLFTDRAFED